VIVYSPMGSGLLTGRMTRERIEHLPADDWRSNDARFREPELSRHLVLVDRLVAVAERHDTSPGAVAVAWALRNPAVNGAIVGFPPPRPGRPDPGRYWPSAHRRRRGRDRRRPGEAGSMTVGLGAIGSPLLRGRAPLVVELPDQAWFDVELAHKDIRLALATAQRDGVPLPAAGLADDWLTTASSLGYGHRDIAALYAVLAQRATTSSERAETSASGSSRGDV